MQDENDAADHQDQAELTKSVVVAAVLGARIKVGSYDGEGDHDAEMNKLAYSFIERIDSKSDVVEDDLKPGKPEDGEEAHI